MWISLEISIYILTLPCGVLLCFQVDFLYFLFCQMLKKDLEDPALKIKAVLFYVMQFLQDLAKVCCDCSGQMQLHLLQEFTLY